MGPKDQVDQAIEAAAEIEAELAPEMLQTNLTIDSTGRPAIVAVPVDITQAEILEIIGWMSTKLRDHARATAAAARARSPKIVGLNGRPI